MFNHLRTTTSQPCTLFCYCNSSVFLGQEFIRDLKTRSFGYTGLVLWSGTRKSTTETMVVRQKNRDSQIRRAVDVGKPTVRSIYLKNVTNIYFPCYFHLATNNFFSRNLFLPPKNVVFQKIILISLVRRTELT